MRNRTCPSTWLYSIPAIVNASTPPKIQCACSKCRPSASWDQSQAIMMGEPAVSKCFISTLPLSSNSAPCLAFWIRLTRWLDPLIAKVVHLLRCKMTRHMLILFAHLIKEQNITHNVTIRQLLQHTGNLCRRQNWLWIARANMDYKISDLQPRLLQATRCQWSQQSSEASPGVTLSLQSCNGKCVRVLRLNDEWMREVPKSGIEPNIYLIVKY